MSEMNGELPAEARKTEVFSSRIRHVQYSRPTLDTYVILRVILVGLVLSSPHLGLLLDIDSFGMAVVIKVNSVDLRSCGIAHQYRSDVMGLGGRYIPCCMSYP